MTHDLLFGLVIGVPFGAFVSFVFQLSTEKVHPAITDDEVRQRVDSAQKCVALANRHLQIVLHRPGEPK